MASSDNITIVCVPPNMFAAVWLRLGDLLRDAVRVAGDMGDIVERIEAEQLQLWLVCDGRKALAACFTDINVEDDGDRWVGVYGLAGDGVRHWARMLIDRLADFAREERCSRVLFAGRKAWGRLLPECKPVRQERHETIWERAA